MRDYDRIAHILGAIDDALESIDGISLEDFLENKVRRAAAERYLMIIGEATHMVSSRLKAAHPEVGWSDMTDMRNMIAHEYMRVDDSALFNVIREMLPEMRARVALIQASLPKPE